MQRYGACVSRGGITLTHWPTGRTGRTRSVQRAAALVWSLRFPGGGSCSSEHRTLEAETDEEEKAAEEEEDDDELGRF